MQTHPGRLSRKDVELLKQIALKDPTRRGHLPQMGSTQLLLTCAIHQLGTDAYGSKTAEVLDGFLRRRVNVGQVYSTATDLVNHGILVTTTRPAPNRNARPVTVYSISEKGRKLIKLILELYKLEAVS